MVRNPLTDLKNVRKNWSIVKSSPYASLKMQYVSAKIIVGTLIAFIAYSMVKIIIMYNGGSSFMTLLGRVIMVALLLFIAFKTWSTLGPFKQRLEAYEKSPQHKTYKRLNVKKEIDDIIASFEHKGGRNKNELSKKEVSGS